MFNKGCDTGFGFQLAKHLTSIGFKVYAGCLRKDQGQGAKDLVTKEFVSSKMW